MASVTEREQTRLQAIKYSYEKMDDKLLKHLESCMLDEINTVLRDTVSRDRLNKVLFECVKYIRGVAILMYLTYERMNKVSELENCKDAIKEYMYVDPKTYCIYLRSMGELVRIKITDIGIVLDFQYAEVFCY